MKKKAIKRIRENRERGRSIELYANDLFINDDAIEMNEEFFLDKNFIVSVEEKGYKMIIHYEFGFKVHL